MKIRNACIALTLICVSIVKAGAQTAPPPRLIVVISLDQFPYEYLVRFSSRFGEGGFRRLVTQGANFSNASYKHAMNMTGPGHAVMLSGAYGNQNGIIANNWYDLATRTTVYCVDDTNCIIVGSKGKGKSPANFIGSTFGDQLRLASGFRSKVVSVSNKDRAAILMGGKLANAAYWLPDSSFVTSTYYVDALPSWVQEFNRAGTVNSYFGRTWNQSLPESAFEGSDKDDVPYEENENGLGRAFPHRMTGKDPLRITASYYPALTTSPFASEILSAFAKAAVRGEQLGKRNVTDLLCISFSSNDYVGHAFGPQSREVFEMTVKTDSIIADLLGFLDAECGAGKYITVLTSDHGIAPIPEYILSRSPHADAGRVPSDTLTVRCERALTARFGAPAQGALWIEKFVDRNIYFNRATLASRRITPDDAARVAAAALLELHAVAAAYTRDQIISLPAKSMLDEKVKRSYHPLRSGDLFYVLKPYFFEGSKPVGTTHSEPYDYDAHVPLIILGGGIKPGIYAGEASPADLAPTLSAITGVEFPAGREGRVLSEALK